FDGIDSTYVKATKLPTTTFHISYNRSWEANYRKAQTGAGAKINSLSVPKQLLKSQATFHLSPMEPSKAVKLVNYIKKNSNDAAVSVSTWIGYIGQNKQRRILRKLATQVDFFMLNECEAKALTETNYLPFAIDKIKTPKLIVTMGKLGAIISGDDNEPQMIPGLSVPKGNVIDTTGAGDTWNGAFLATFIKTRDLMKSVTAASIMSSIKCSAWGFEAIENLRFKKPSDLVEYVMALREGRMQKKISDYK
ncbi:MAG: carbohydrate kinase family protein, partial [Candidatus Bathyarchaeota archaeon]